MQELQPYRYRVLEKSNDQLVVFNWWLGLEQRKGERAALRRCENLEASLQILAMQRLRYALAKTEIQVSEAAIAAVALLLAEIRRPVFLLDKPDSEWFNALMQEAPQSLATKMGGERESGAKKPLISELRFQRLLQAAMQDHDDFITQLRRIVKQFAKVTLNPIMMADQVFYRFRTIKDPDIYTRARSFNYLLAKDYYQEVLTYTENN